MSVVLFLSLFLVPVDLGDSAVKGAESKAGSRRQWLTFVITTPRSYSTKQGRSLGVHPSELSQVVPSSHMLLVNSSGPLDGGEGPCNAARSPYVAVQHGEARRGKEVARP